MTGRHRNNGHDTLTVLVVQSKKMQDDITWIRGKIDYLYRVDPPGPIMKLGTHLDEEKEEKRKQRWREYRNLTLVGFLIIVLDRFLALFLR